jgi:hypothetical protein
MQTVFATIRQVAVSDVPVLVVGESGTIQNYSWPRNVRILGVNLLPRDTVVDAASNTLCAWAFHDGIREAQFSALWG